MTPRPNEPAGTVRPTPRPPTPPAGDEALEDAVDEAGAESFPASDAPQWWSGEPDTRS